MDETGLRIGVGCGQWVVVPADKLYNTRFIQNIASLGSTEHIIVVECISASGQSIAPLVIIKGVVIQERWFAELELGDIAIGISEFGYSNDTLSFLWLQHFDRLSKPENDEKRLLILDGYDSHLIFQFVRFCELNSIIVLQLLPHSTHFHTKSVKIKLIIEHREGLVLGICWQIV